MIQPIYENRLIADWSLLTDTVLEFKLLNSDEIFNVDFAQMVGKVEVFTSSTYKETSFEIIGVFILSQVKQYIFIENGKVFVADHMSIDDSGLKVNINFFDERFYLDSTAAQLSIKDSKSDWCYLVDEKIFFLKSAQEDEKIFVDTPISGSDNPHLFFRITVDKYNAFFEVYRNSARYVMKYLRYRTLSEQLPNFLRIDCLTFNKIKITCENDEFIISRDRLGNGRQKISILKKHKLDHPLFFEINGNMFVIEAIKNTLYIQLVKKDDGLIKKFSPRAMRVFHYFVCFGLLKYKFDVMSLDLKKVMTGYGLHVGNVHNFRGVFFFVVDLNKMGKVTSFHNRLWLGEFIHRLKKSDIEDAQNISIANYKNNSILMRFNNQGMLSVSVVPRSKQYELFNRLKQNVAYYLVRARKRIFGYKPKINLYFEKDCSRAEESGYRVFQNVMLQKKLESQNFYILDERASYFDVIKKKYPDNLVKRFSFKHYYLLFSATNLISSELSNHVVEVRVLVEKLTKKINSTPLYFLQHGIMFAKPVENPMARGFYKSDMSFTLTKSVISSDLEAREFYKMGYKDSELMKTGLATFDYAKRDSDADKIVYMPTYRYWEEKAIINGQLNETSYFYSIMEVVREFEKNGLIDRLLITPHNKLSEYILNYMPEYKHIICDNPSIALTKSCIFISDYSSAIYDAIYRGAYPIFYWKDSEYLIKNYQATPPVNVGNAPGVIAWDEKELMTNVIQAIKNNYEIEPENLIRYRRINEFYDGKNTKRIIEVLKKDSVI